MTSDKERRKSPPRAGREGARRTQGEGLPANDPRRDVRKVAAKRAVRHAEEKSGRLIERSRSAREVSGN